MTWDEWNVYIGRNRRRTNTDMDKPLINYKDYEDRCLAMRMKAFNEILECRYCIVPGMKGVALFLGNYAFHEMKEDGADYL